MNRIIKKGGINMSKIIEVTKDEFKQEVLERDLPVLVDFYTDGCGPCEAMVPVLDALSERLDGKIQIIKHKVTMEDVLEEKSWIVKEYDVLGFPTLMVFKDGEMVKQNIGALFETEMLEFLKDVL